MSSQTDNEFGTIEFIRSTKAKNINVRILEDRLRVSLPRRATEKEAMAFIDSVRDKIIRKQQKIKNNVRANNLVLREGAELQTLTFSVVLKFAKRSNLFISLKDKLLTIEFPEGMDISTDEVQEHCWNGIKYFLKKEAKRVLPQRTKILAEQYGFSYSSVKIQSSRSRWGSCSQGKNINLSFYLMMLPQPLVDYVILHELCHTKEMNHGPAFWAWMDKVTDGQSKKLRAQVKKYQMPK